MSLGGAPVQCKNPLGATSSERSQIPQTLICPHAQQGRALEKPSVTRGKEKAFQLPHNYQAGGQRRRGKGKKVLHFALNSI